MTVRLKADGATGKVAIYDYTTENDDPFTSPLSHVSRLRFHSDLPYPAIIRTESGISVQLPSVAAGVKADADTTWTTNLFSHGRSGIPYVEGKITSGLGAVVGLCGSVPVQRNSGSSGASTCFRVINLGADATHVTLTAYGLPFATQGFSSLDLTLTVYVFDTLLT